MATMKRLSRNLETIKLQFKQFDGKELKVGWFAGNNYPDGTSVASVAETQEFGDASKNIPPRPFMRVAIAENKMDWKRIMGRSATAIINGEQNIATALEILGAKAVSDVREAINNVTEPALSLVTLLNRQRRRKLKTLGEVPTKPLIDTGVMISTVSYRVGDAE